MGSRALDDFVDGHHRALDEFFRGNPEPAKRLYSHREDGFDTLATCVTPALAYVVEVERFAATVAGQPGAAGALRVTTILRREDVTRRIEHRHADPITAQRAPDSVFSGRSTTP